MVEKIKKAIHDGKINFSDISISCAVLENGQRVLVQRSTANALGVKGGGAHWERKRKGKKDALLPEYISAKYLQPFITDEAHAKLLQTITYINKSGKMAEALPAENLPEICDIWIKADHSGTLDEGGKSTAEVAYIIMKGLATVGIVALVDEATGYQDARAKDALARLLEQYLAKELRKWVKTFPNEYYKELFKLRNWPYNDNSTKRAPLVGRITNDLIYERLEPNILHQLEQLNPKDDVGRRKNKHHQWLSDRGHPKLREHIASVVTLMKAASNWRSFQSLLNRALPKQTPLPLFDKLDGKNTE